MNQYQQNHRMMRPSNLNPDLMSLMQMQIQRNNSDAQLLQGLKIARRIRQQADMEA